MGVAAAASTCCFRRAFLSRRCCHSDDPKTIRLRAGGGATFHEHMSLAPDFLVQFRRYAAEGPGHQSPAERSTVNGAGGPPPDLSFMRDLDLLA